MPTDRKFKFGETIIFKVTTKNTGTVNISNIDVKASSKSDTVNINHLNAKLINAENNDNSYSFNVKHTVTMADVIRGYVEETGKVVDCDFTGRNNYEIKDFCIDGLDRVLIEEFNPSLILEITDISNPRNGTSYVLGETITFTITATNNGNVDFSKVVINDTRANKIDDNYRCNCNYIVTEQDILNGYIDFTASLTDYTFKPSAPYEESFCNDATVRLYNVMPFEPSIQLGISASNPANGSEYVLGERVTFTITATNNGTVDFSEITLQGELNGAPESSRHTKTNYNSGATYQYTVSHTITENDIIRGYIDYSASLYDYTFVDNISWTESFCNDASLVLDNISNPNPHVTLSAVTTSTPADGNDYYIGETIVFSVTAKNTGNISFSSIEISNLINNALKNKSTRTNFITGVSPYTYQVNHTVTKEDMDRGYVDFKATLSNYVFKTPFTWSGSICDDVELRENNIGNFTPSIVLGIKASNPANGSEYVLGERVTFTVTAKNEGTVDFSSIVIDGMLNDSPEAKHTKTNYNSGATYQYTVNHTITEDDLIRGYINYEASLYDYTFVKNIDWDEDFCNDVSLQLNNIEDPNPCLTVKAVTTSTPANGTNYALGETIKYKVTVTNCGNLTLTNVRYDLFGTGKTLTSLNPGGSNEITVDYVVRESDIIAGKVVANPTASGSNASSYNTNVTRIPVTVNTVAANPRATITIQAPNTLYAYGDSIQFNLVIKNTGNLTLTNIVYGSQLLGAEWTVTSLGPGESVTKSKQITISTQNSPNYKINVTSYGLANTPYTSISTINCSNRITCGTVTKDVYDTWKYTINTQATTSGSKITSIPLNLYDSSSGTSIIVDWGDNNKSTFTKNNYTSSTALDDTSNTGLLHTYSKTGTFTVTIYSTKFNDITLFNSNSNTVRSPINYFRKTLTKVNTAFPKLNTTNFSYCLWNCTKLTSIPTGLFDKNPGITNFGFCFQYCSSLSAIPTDLFRYNTVAENFRSTFNGCSKITSIPANLFRYNGEAINFLGTFFYCSKLASIPTDLFRYNKKVTTFYACFKGVAIKSIPTDIFRYNTEVTDFTGVFEECASLKTIPTDLFRYNTKATKFIYCFEQCSSLVSLPTDIFRYNVNATTFQNCFYECTSLSSIQVDLFRYNTAVTNFYNCFYGCSSLNNFTVRIGSTKVTNCDYFVKGKTGTTRIVRVPANSTTKTTFDNQASYLGLTIQTI